MNIQTDDYKIINNFWGCFTVHIISEIFGRISQTRRCTEDDHIHFFPKNSHLSKTLLITGFYESNYQDKDIFHMATHPNSKIHIPIISNTHILCHINANEPCDTVRIIFYKNDCFENLEYFFDEVQQNIDIILSVYFDKIIKFHIFNPLEELPEISDFVPKIYDSGIKKDRTDIFKDIKTVHSSYLRPK